MEALSLALQTEALKEALHFIRAGERSVVVFDLDGTLFDNRPRTLAILNQAADSWAAQHPEAARAVRSLRFTELGYLATEALERVGVERALIEQAVQLWRERFFTDSVLCHDVPLAGAVTFAKACYEAGANLAYLTGRDLPNMALGTFGSLRDAGFPIGVAGTELILKPDFETPDLTFKRDIIPEITRLGRVAATFDNEPGNCNAFADMFPEGHHFMMLTQYAPNPPPLKGNVAVIEDFQMES